MKFSKHDKPIIFSFVITTIAFILTFCISCSSKLDRAPQADVDARAGRTETVAVLKKDEQPKIEPALHIPESSSSCSDSEIIEASTVGQEPDVNEIVEPALHIKDERPKSEIKEVETEEVETEEVEIKEVETKKAFDLTDSEFNLLCKVVYLEGGVESEECQKAICSVILNRMTTGNKSLHDVIYASNQFSVVGHIDSCNPSSTTCKYVEDVVCDGITIPEYVTFFRANHCFNWGDRYCNYTNIDRTYFTYDTYLKARLEKGN